MNKFKAGDQVVIVSLTDIDLPHDDPNRVITDPTLKNDLTLDWQGPEKELSWIGQIGEVMVPALNDYYDLTVHFPWMDNNEGASFKYENVEKIGMSVFATEQQVVEPNGLDGMYLDEEKLEPAILKVVCNGSGGFMLTTDGGQILVSGISTDAEIHAAVRYIRNVIVGTRDYGKCENAEAFLVSDDGKVATYRCGECGKTYSQASVAETDDGETAQQIWESMFDK
jgi:hypothetical protein